MRKIALLVGFLALNASSWATHIAFKPDPQTPPSNNPKRAEPAKKDSKPSVGIALKYGEFESKLSDVTLEKDAAGKFLVKDFAKKLDNSLDQKCAAEFMGVVVDALNSINLDHEADYLKQRFNIEKPIVRMSALMSLDSDKKPSLQLSAFFEPFEKNSAFVLWYSSKDEKDKCRPKKEVIQASIKELLFTRVPEELELPKDAEKILKGRTYAVKGSNLINEPRIMVLGKGEKGGLKTWLQLVDGVAKIRVDEVNKDGVVKGTLIIPELKKDSFYTAQFWTDKTAKEFGKSFQGEHKNYDTLKYHMLGDEIKEPKKK